ncbi:uncharacterized protein LOC108741952 isoform X2 [Agrilus planipennis]|uniref:Uncharacterized protein LOC108741952 isoform X2 n=1 Tax=Agrilus planipennis TaxID=224129 RepID=A0A1W4XI18_AGRPL|nr:uncharacterized protein LOC108741952 isoform X2 [Agrilus planipennis]
MKPIIIFWFLLYTCICFIQLVTSEGTSSCDFNLNDEFFDGDKDVILSTLEEMFECANDKMKEKRKQKMADVLQGIDCCPCSV